MEQNKFKEIVDTLLQPQPKDYIIEQRKLQRRSLTTNFSEDSMRLAPVKILDRCSDCEKEVAGRIVHIRKRAMGTFKEHWEHKCMSCKHIKKIKSLHER